MLSIAITAIAAAYLVCRPGLLRCAVIPSASVRSIIQRIVEVCLFPGLALCIWRAVDAVWQFIQTEGASRLDLVQVSGTRL